ncbi:MAG: aldo/keto reductase, partial [Bacillota bacterium]
LHSNQPPYSLLDRGIEGSVLPYCREHGIAVLVYSPLARGLLTGKFTQSATFPPGDSRAEEPRFQGEQLRRNLQKVEKLKVLAAELGKTVAQLAVRWVLDQPGVTVALWGARRPGQIAEAAGVAGWTLTPEVLQRIEAIMQDGAASL